LPSLLPLLRPNGWTAPTSMRLPLSTLLCTSIFLHPFPTLVVQISNH
jgi:hypothetical protein